MMKKLIGIVFFYVLVQGCAFTKAELNINYDKQKAEKGPLSSAAPLKIQVLQFTDHRNDNQRIGYKINGLGMNTADILSEKPVTEIMRSAIETLLEKNGYLLETESPLRIAGDVKEFWFEQQINMMTIEFMGTMRLDLKVKDAVDKTLYNREYQGHYNEKKAAGYTGSWEKVMNITLEKLMYQIVTDEELVKILNAQAVQPQAEVKQ